jgi:hypothetical protein
MGSEEREGKPAPSGEDEKITHTSMVRVTECGAVLKTTGAATFEKRGKCDLILE